MRKVCVVVLSRANYGRIKSVMKAIKEHPDLELQVITGASMLLDRFGNAVEVLRNDGFEVNETVYMIIEGENPTTMAKSTGLAIMELATSYENIAPDIVLSVADRFETMATAVAARYMNIPLAHTQGGEASGSIDESIRHAITKLSHIHFVSTRLSAERVFRMGESRENIHVTGCPSLDIIAGTDLNITDSLKKFVRSQGVGGSVDIEKDYIVVSQHPVTTEYESAAGQIKETLSAVYGLRLPAIWLWPNVDAGSDAISKEIRKFREHHNTDFIRFFKNFTVEDYARIIYNSKCVIGNSSSGIREGSFMGVPAVNIGTRQSGRERSDNVIDAGYKKDEITSAVKKQLAHGRYKKSPLYGDGTSGRQIADILARCKVVIQKNCNDGIR